MPYVEVEPGVNIHYREFGNPRSRPLLLVHGWTLNHQTWDRQIQILQEQYRVIAIDLRGHGDSDKPSGDYSVDRLANDVLGVADALNLTNATLVGWSFGGTTSILAAARDESRFSQLVLVNAAGPKYTATDAGDYGHPSETVQSWIVEERDNLEAWRHSVMTSMPKEPYSDALTSWLFQQSMRTPSWAAAPMLRACAAVDLRPELSKIVVPTLIIHGTHDVFCSVTGAEQLQAGIGEARLERFDKSGHSPQYEEPGRFNEVLLTFLSEG